MSCRRCRISRWTWCYATRPCIKRSYGYWTDEEWFALMKPVVRECRRVLKPKGSAVFILQPNSEKVGRMRPWLWDFLSWCSREWNVVQDHYWWNYTALPTVHCHRDKGLMRPSVKMGVWLGNPDCYRNQNEVLWLQSEHSKAKDRQALALRYSPSTVAMRDGRLYATADERGGTTPFNLLPIANSESVSSAGAEGHCAGTPEPLMDWWIRYLTRPGDTVLDPFSGTATTGRAALRLHRRYIGIERIPEYHEIAGRLLAGPPMPLFSTGMPGFDGYGGCVQPKQSTLF